MSDVEDQGEGTHTDHPGGFDHIETNPASGISFETAPGGPGLGGVPDEQAPSGPPEPSGLQVVTDYAHVMLNEPESIVVIDAPGCYVEWTEKSAADYPKMWVPGPRYKLQGGGSVVIIQAPGCEIWQTDRAKGCLFNNRGGPNRIPVMRQIEHYVEFGSAEFVGTTQSYLPVLAGGRLVERRDVAGYCPICGMSMLRLAKDQEITCMNLSCPNPTFVSDMLQLPRTSRKR